MRGRVGFVGLGIMGAPMARNLIAEGYELVVHNRSPEKAEALAGEGATVAGSPVEVAERSEIVVAMLPGPPEVEAVFGEMMGVAARGTLLVDMSTSSPVLARKLAEGAREKGIGVLDAPVSGGDVGAIEGTLSIMVGGERDDSGNKVMEVKREKLLGRDFSPGGKSRFHLKDLGIALASARESGVPLPVTAVVNEMFGALVAQGRGDQDHSALLALLDGWARRADGPPS